MTTINKDLEWRTEVASGEYNRELRVDAEEDGLLIDESCVVTWEWILKALAIVRPSLIAKAIPVVSVSIVSAGAGDYSDGDTITLTEGVSK